MASDFVQFRRDFWTRYAELYPDDGVPSGWGRSFVWVPVGSADLNVSLYLVHDGVALGLKGRKKESSEDAEPRVRPLRDAFRQAIGEALAELPFAQTATEGSTAGEFDTLREFDVSDPENWQNMAAWLHYMLHIYLRVIENALVAQE